MSGTRSPNGDGGRPAPPDGWLRRVGPRTFQARLTLAFVGAVALTLALASFLVLNRLDDYFQTQQRADLEARAQTVWEYVATVATQEASLRPVVYSNGVLDPAVAARLGSAAQERILADWLAQADVTITFGLVDDQRLVPASNGVIHASLQAQARDGQSREEIEVPIVREVTGTFVPFAVEVVLSGPYTYRASTTANVGGLLAVISLISLALAVIVAAGLARRITTPLRRLTEASRRLAEGDLSSRVPLDQVRGGSSELFALAIQFNAMAERLEESVTIIRRDRDRSRDFLADVSHELRTPIAALRTFNELLKDHAGADPAARAEFLEAAGGQIDRLDWLAQNLLDLSKLDSGLVLLDVRADDLRAAVESAVEQAEAAAHRRGVELAVELPDAPIRIGHDPQRIGQVVANLVGNAIKFTPPGGRVTVSAAAEREGARIVVADTGVGIDASELPRIFERFYRGSRANEARGSGSGLGLAIVRSIVDMHGGTIAVESRLGSGSRFTVHLPRDPREAHDGRGAAQVGTEHGVQAGDRAGMVADSSSSEGALLNPRASR